MNSSEESSDVSESSESDTECYYKAGKGAAQLQNKTSL